jgi:hypothetical protein
LGPLCLLGALLVVSTAGSATANTQRGAQLDKITIAAIALDPAGPVMYAKDRGFFRRQGIDAEIKIVADGDANGAGPALGPGSVRRPTDGRLAQLGQQRRSQLVAAGALYQPGCASGVFVCRKRIATRDSS